MYEHGQNLVSIGLIVIIVDLASHVARHFADVNVAKRHILSIHERRNAIGKDELEAFYGQLSPRCFEFLKALHI